VQKQLLGDWRSADGKEELKLRRLDDNIYIDCKFACVVWKLSDDGKHLSLRNVSDKVISKEIRDSGTVAALLTKNVSNLEFFGEQIEFRKEK
jgi:hypothetical protein